jgi:hypothetical protein
VALGHPSDEASSAVAGAASAPLACSLVAERQGGGTRLEARMTARDAMTASYELAVRGPGVTIDQGGDLTLAAGESAVLGEANVSTAPANLDVRLTVTAAGTTYACPVQEP